MENNFRPVLCVAVIIISREGNVSTRLMLHTYTIDVLFSRQNEVPSITGEFCRDRKGGGRERERERVLEWGF